MLAYSFTEVPASTLELADVALVAIRFRGTKSWLDGQACPEERIAAHDRAQRSRKLPTKPAQHDPGIRQRGRYRCGLSGLVAGCLLARGVFRRRSSSWMPSQPGGCCAARRRRVWPLRRYAYFYVGQPSDSTIHLRLMLATNGSSWQTDSATSPGFFTDDCSEPATIPICAAFRNMCDRLYRHCLNLGKAEQHSDTLERSLRNDSASRSASMCSPG